MQAGAAFYHLVALAVFIFSDLYHFRISRLYKARPAGAAIIFIVRRKKHVARGGAYVHAFLVIVPIRVMKWFFGAAVHHNVKSLRRENLFPTGSAFSFRPVYVGP